MKVILKIDSKISFNWKKLKDKACVKYLKDEFKHTNPVFIRNQRIGIPNDNEPEEYFSFEIKKSRIYFSRGCLKKIKKILKMFGHTSKIKDRRVEGDKTEFNSKVKLRKEQEPAVEAGQVKQQGIIIAPPSAGKSVMGLELIARVGKVSMVVVWNKDHQKQWIEEAQRSDLLNLSPEEIGGVGGKFSKRKLGKLNVCMQQSLWNEDHREFFFNHCGVLVADEIQRYAANTFNAVINDSPAKIRIGLTADEKRKDAKHFLIHDAFGERIHVVQDNNIGSRKKARINLVPTNYTNDCYEFDKRTPELLNDMARDKSRNKIIIKRTLQKTSKKKLVLILLERKFQALYLKEKLESENLKVKLLVGKFTKSDIEDADDWKPSWKEFASSYDDDKEFFEIKKLGANKEIDVVIATQKGDVGLSIKTIDHVIISTPTGGNLERFNQQKGRAERDYDDELKKKFGKKATPSVDYLWDIKIESIRKKGNSILKNYTNVSVLQKRSRKNVK